MKNFAAAIVILSLLVGITVFNAGLTKNAAADIERAVKLIDGETTEENGERIAEGIRVIEEKRSVLKLSLRHTQIDQVAQLLNEAHAYCLAGDAPSMNAAVAAVLYKLERWKDIESFTLYNVL